MELNNTGNVAVEINIGEHKIVDEHYPMCGNAIQISWDNAASVRPDTYKRLVWKQ